MHPCGPDSPPSSGPHDPVHAMSLYPARQKGSSAGPQKGRGVQGQGPEINRTRGPHPSPRPETLPLPLPFSWPLPFPKAVARHPHPSFFCTCFRRIRRAIPRILARLLRSVAPRARCCASRVNGARSRDARRASVRSRRNVSAERPGAPTRVAVADCGQGSTSAASGSQSGNASREFRYFS